MVGNAGCRFYRLANLPYVEFVVEQVVVMALVGSAPNKPLAVGRETREVFVAAAARQVHQLYVLRNAKEADLLDLLAVFRREPEDFARSSGTAVTRRIHSINLATVKIPVNLATVTGLGPGILFQIPHARFAHGTAKRNRDMLAIGAHVRFLQNHATLVEGLFAIQHQLFRLACEVHRKDLPRTAKHDGLAIGSPGSPCGVVDDLAGVLARNIDHPEVPLFGVVRVVFRNPAALAAVKQHRRAIRRNTREPVHIVAARERTGIAAIGVHDPDVMMRICTARRPDNRPLKFALESRKRFLLIGGRVDGGTRRRPLFSKDGRRRSNQQQAEQRFKQILHKYPLLYEKYKKFSRQPERTFIIAPCAQKNTLTYVNLAYRRHVGSLDLHHVEPARHTFEENLHGTRNLAIPQRTQCGTGHGEQVNAG